MNAPLLEISSLTVAYGRHSPVLKEISLTVEQGEVVGLVGMNGAGKSTLMSSISGELKPTSGHILFEGVDVAGKGAAVLARKGIVVLPEGHRVIRPLSVDENLQLSTMKLRPAEVKKRLAEVRGLIYELFPVLYERRSQLAGLLSGGEQQMLSVSRAIVQNPKLLLLDEPSLGLAPLIIDRIYQSLDTLRERGMSILIVEQNSERVARACSRLIVLREGRISAEGIPDVLTGPALNAAYFG